MKKVNIIYILGFFLVAAFSSCVNNAFEIADITFETDENGILQVGEGYVALSVYGNDGAEILKDVIVKYKTDASVFDITQFVAQEKKIQLEYNGVSPNYYVMGIDNLYEFDHGSNSGWLFKVNGTFLGTSSGKQIIKDQDHIEWFYTTDLGKDVGGEFTG